jgi:queuine tRNA-ribosyltransferase
VVRDATDRTIRWAQRCKAAARRPDQAQFGIVQGGLDPTLRVSCAEALAEFDFQGYAVGGLSVGEEPAEMYRMLDYTVPVLPADRPRYLMGVGRPEDLLEGIRRGVDLFDCVLPTRNGRNAMAFTDRGRMRLRNLQYERDDSPLEEGCPCPACQRSRGYLRHLFMAGEMLAPILLSLHNLTYYQRLLAEARAAIAADRFVEFHAGKLAGWGANASSGPDS